MLCSSGFDEHDVALSHARGGPLEVGGIDHTVIGHIKMPDHAGPVEAVEWHLIHCGPVADEMSRCVEMGAVMNHHMNFGDVRAVLRDFGDLSDARLRKRGNARKLLREPM